MSDLEKGRGEVVEKVEATPRPGEWRVEPAGEICPNDRLLIEHVGYHDNGIQIVRTIGRTFAHHGKEFADEQAARIVHAVNNIDRITAERDALKHDIERLRKAAENFVAKVERGEARSTASYAEFKAALSPTQQTDSDVTNTAR